jgi:uncharacterized protein (TIGR02594 family)
VHKSPLLQNSPSTTATGGGFGEARNAFGSGIKERTANFGGAYRFGMNTQEKEVELGEGVTSAEFWMYDGKLGRRWNRDILSNLFPFMSPYSVFFANPLFFIDFNGAKPEGWVKPPPKNENSTQNTNRTYNVYKPDENGILVLTQENLDTRGIEYSKFATDQKSAEAIFGTGAIYMGDELIARMYEDENDLVGYAITLQKNGSIVIGDYKYISEISISATPRWVSIAFKEKEKKPQRIPGPESDPNIAKYFSSDPKQPTLNDDYSWCAAFVNYCLVKGGYQTPKVNPYYTYNWYNGKGQPFNWENGHKIPKNQPVYGGIVFFNWGHVGIIVGKRDNYIYCLGGNQGPSEINVTPVNILNISAIMLPNNYNPPNNYYSEDFLRTSYTGPLGPTGSTR